ncbi:unnamed protein product [Rhizoctonia solani]|uniref:Uncharacterized protein n=1 Tax=Rhizoctonia solani TaxID=456999 RepID=A0A8H3GFJ2_9AGAM|nr:unnamed protein product [Rhizoctonia solani]
MLDQDFNLEGVPDDLQRRFDDYHTNLTQVIYDVKIMATNPNESEYFQILGGLLDGPLISTRCIIGFAGVVLTSLSLIAFVHSELGSATPRDRHERRVIIIRFFMGLVLCLLLLLNVGKYQEFFVPEDEMVYRAGVFRWFEAFWVLPTIAIAYGIQFLIEISSAERAKCETKKEERVREGEENRP